MAVRGCYFKKTTQQTEEGGDLRPRENLCREGGGDFHTGT